MGLGLSFGSNKTKTAQNTTATKNENQVQSGTSNTNATTTNSQTQTGSTTSASQGTSTTGSTTSQNTTGTGSQQQQQTTNLFDSGTLGGLQNLVSSLLGDTDGSGGVALHKGLSQLGEFNLNDFVESGLRSAQAKQGTQIDEMIGGLLDTIGGRNNSATALLSNRVAGDAEANLSGIRSNLIQTGQGILQSGIQTAQTAVSNSRDFLVNLVNQLKGGTQATTGVTNTTTNEAQTGGTSATTNTSESNQQSSVQQTDATQQLIQVLSQLLNTNTNTNATEAMTGTNTSKGGGISYGS